MFLRATQCSFSLLRNIRNNNSLTQCQFTYLQFRRFIVEWCWMQGRHFKEMNVRSVKSYLSLILMDQGFVILQGFIILIGETFIKSSDVWPPEFSALYFSEDWPVWPWGFLSERIDTFLYVVRLIEAYCLWKSCLHMPFESTQDVLSSLEIIEEFRRKDSTKNPRFEGQIIPKPNQKAFFFFFLILWLILG